MARAAASTKATKSTMKKPKTTAAASGKKTKTKTKTSGKAATSSAGSKKKTKGKVATASRSTGKAPAKSSAKSSPKSAAKKPAKSPAQAGGKQRAKNAAKSTVKTGGKGAAKAPTKTKTKGKIGRTSVAKTTSRTLTKGKTAKGKAAPAGKIGKKTSTLHAADSQDSAMTPAAKSRTGTPATASKRGAKGVSNPAADHGVSNAKAKKSAAATTADTGDTTKKTKGTKKQKAPQPTDDAVTEGTHSGADHAEDEAEIESSPVPQVGDEAPEFSLPTDEGETVSLHNYHGRKNVLLYFYPKDDTPGCTKQACAFQADLSQFQAHDTVVIGVSPDDATSHGKFRNKYSLGFPLAIDDGAEVARSYGVWVKKNLYGRQYMGVERATFLIGKDGMIAAVWPKVKVEGHSGEVITAIASLNSEAGTAAGADDDDEDEDEGEDDGDGKATKSSGKRRAHHEDEEDEESDEAETEDSEDDDAGSGPTGDEMQDDGDDEG